MNTADPLAGVSDETHPHLADLSGATKRRIIVGARAAADTAPPPSPTLIEQLRVILREPPIKAKDRAA